MGGIWWWRPRFRACGLGQGGCSGRYLEVAAKIRSLWPLRSGQMQWEEIRGDGSGEGLAAYTETNSRGLGPVSHNIQY